MTILAMTKIAVRDMEKQTAFYERVASFSVTQTIELPGFKEVIMAPADGGGGAALVLVREEGSDPLSGSTMLVFETGDIKSFAGRVEDAGGSITRPIERLDDLGLSFAFFVDPEGNALEAVHRSSS